MQKIVLVRYKKDLRIADHKPLYDAILSGYPVVAFFCFEPSIINEPDFSAFHEKQLVDSLVSLKDALDKYSIPLIVLRQEVKDVITLFIKYFSITGVYAHEETGNNATYQRDKDIIIQLKSLHIPFHETPSNGVIRKLKNRDNRRSRWSKRILTPIIPSLEALKNYTKSITIPNEILKKELKSISMTLCLPDGHQLQPGGIYFAEKYLKSFLEGRYKNYLYHIGNPFHSRRSSSRLSTYLTYGNMSMKMIYQKTLDTRIFLVEQKRKYNKSDIEYKAIQTSIKHLQGFISRLHRHCHFIQKLESDTSYETQNIHPYYDRIRQKKDSKILEARKKGETGYPLIDAAMKCLSATGWINFRLRATLVSFICNTCLQDRKEPAIHLACLFSDYEPGIHYSQFQMQAGTTGINQYRIYNPTKQLIDKDPQFKFIDKRLPQLQGLPDELKREPWRLDQGLFGNQRGVRLGIDYPSPIVNLEQANRKAKKILRDLKKEPGFREISSEIYYRHGSRKGSVKKQ